MYISFSRSSLVWYFQLMVTARPVILCSLKLMSSPIAPPQAQQQSLKLSLLSYPSTYWYSYHMRMLTPSNSLSVQVKARNLVLADRGLAFLLLNFFLLGVYKGSCHHIYYLILKGQQYNPGAPHLHGFIQHQFCDMRPEGSIGQRYRLHYTHTHTHTRKISCITQNSMLSL